MLVKYFAPSCSFFDTTNPGLDLCINSTNANANISRKIFFLTKSKNSIRLYASVFRAHTDFRISEYYYNIDIGNDNCEDDDWCLEKKPLTWKSSHDFSKHLANFDIHLMLDSVFEQFLKCDFVKADNIQLLILDDVHKIVSNNNNMNIQGEFSQDCYSRIIRKLRDSGFTKNSPNYRILGLSASILIENVSSKVFECMISKIEAELDCTCETYADLRMINKYSIPCRIRVKYYSPLTMSRFETGKSFFMVDQNRLKLSLFMVRNYSSQYYNFLYHLMDLKLSEKVLFFIFS